MAETDTKSKKCTCDFSIKKWFNNRSSNEQKLIYIIIAILIFMLVNKYSDRVINLFCSQRNGILPRFSRGIHSVADLTTSTTSPFFSGASSTF